MANIGGCSVIIKDDFNNLLLVKRKARKTEPKLWGLCAKKLKGKESNDKCASRAVKEDLSVVAFDLKEVSVLQSSDDVNHMLYVGSIKEKFVSHKDIEECKWVNIDRINELELNSYDREMILTYLKDI